VQVKYNRDLCKVILGIWSWSVLQFTMVFTATKAPRREGVSTVTTNTSDSCCTPDVVIGTPDVVGIIMSIFMQDGPFLVLRLLLIIKYRVFSYTNMFFTCKNTLVCMLLMYRLVVIQVCPRVGTWRSTHAARIFLTTGLITPINAFSDSTLLVGRQEISQT